MLRVDPRVNPSEYLVDLSQNLTQFYWGEPWRDRYVCNNCLPPGEVDKNDFKFDEKVKKCPYCNCSGDNIDKFWSLQRTRAYMENKMKKEKFLFIGVFDKEKIVGWIWGYEEKSIANKKTFYIDMIGLKKEYRRKKLFLEVLVFLKINYFLRIDYFDFILGKVFSISENLFLELIRNIKDDFEWVSTKTHHRSGMYLSLIHI